MVHPKKWSLLRIRRFWLKSNNWHIMATEGRIGEHLESGIVQLTINRVIWVYIEVLTYQEIPKLMLLDEVKVLQSTFTWAMLTLIILTYSILQLSLRCYINTLRSSTSSVVATIVPSCSTSFSSVRRVGWNLWLAPCFVLSHRVNFLQTSFCSSPGGWKSETPHFGHCWTVSIQALPLALPYAIKLAVFLLIIWLVHCFCPAPIQASSCEFNRRSWTDWGCKLISHHDIQRGNSQQKP